MEAIYIQDGNIKREYLDNLSDAKQLISNKRNISVIGIYDNQTNEVYIPREKYSPILPDSQIESMVDNDFEILNRIVSKIIIY